MKSSINYRLIEDHDRKDILIAVGEMSTTDLIAEGREFQGVDAATEKALDVCPIFTHVE